MRRIAVFTGTRAEYGLLYWVIKNLQLKKNIDLQLFVGGMHLSKKFGSTIEHDCKIGKNNHIAPGAVLCGQSCTMENVHVGTGASVIQGVTIGKDAIIAAGASIARDVEKNTLCMPASVSKKLL